MKKILTLLSILLLTTTLLAQPQVTEVTGDWNTSLTISGQFFGNKPNAAPLEWETWQTYPYGPENPLDDVQSYWGVFSDNPVGDKPHVSTDRLRYQGNRSLELRTPTSVWGQPGASWETVWNTTNYAITDTVFVSFWLNREYGGEGTRNQKYFSLASQFHNGNSDGCSLNLYQNFSDVAWSLYFLHRPGNEPQNSYVDCDAGGFDGNGRTYASAPQPNLQWYRSTLILVLADACDINGGYFKTYSHLESDSAPFIGQVTPLSLHEDLEGYDQINQIVMKNYLDELTGSGYNLSASYYFDDIYVDNSLARVELGNASTYDACTHVEMMPPTTWAPSNITVDTNTGSFDSGETAWVFVFNSVNEVSDGFEVVIGTEIIGPTLPGQPGQPVRTSGGYVGPPANFTGTQQEFIDLIDNASLLGLYVSQYPPMNLCSYTYTWEPPTPDADMYLVQIYEGNSWVTKAVTSSTTIRISVLEEGPVKIVPFISYNNETFYGQESITSTDQDEIDY